VRRRQFIAGLGSAAAWPVAARAQQTERVRRAGVLIAYPKTDPIAQSSLSAFVQALTSLGWQEGRNIEIQYRWADGGFDQMQKLASELVALRPDIIFAFHGAPVLTALAQETHTIPIVFSGVSDPVGLGFVESLARPGGNITGFAVYHPSFGSKWLDLLRRIAPDIKRIVLIYNPRTSVPELYLPSIEAAAATFATDLVKTPVLDPAEIEPAIAAATYNSGTGLIFLPDTFLIAHRETIISAVARFRVPAIYALHHFVADGGLMSYGSDLDDLNRRSVSYVDRILKGERPADLPVQQPTTFQFVINIKTAKALGLEIPPMLLSLADEVID
jgi:ABC-type uncharacterized transport system substrate-binding protein